MKKKILIIAILTLFTALLTGCAPGSFFALFGISGGSPDVPPEPPTDVTAWMDLNSGETITMMASGDTHRIYVTSDNRILAWGNNEYGQLGKTNPNWTDDFIDITSRFSFAPGETVSTLSVGGGNHSLILTSHNRVFSWGYNGEGSVGNSTFDDQKSPQDITSIFNLQSGETITWLIAGNSNRAAAITSSGKLFTWGHNYYGTLLDGTENNLNVPTDVTANIPLQSGEGVQTIGFSSYNAYLLTTNGRLLTMGMNSSGQLGYGYEGSQTTTLAEARDAFGLHVGESITKVIPGPNMAMILTSENRIIAFGNNDWGILGAGTSQYYLVTPRDITDYFNLQAGESVIEIRSSNHMIALTSNHRIFAWGYHYSQIDFDMRELKQNYPREMTDKLGLQSGEYISHFDAGNSARADAYGIVQTNNGRLIDWTKIVFNDFDYTIANDEVTITGYNGSHQVLYIPDELDWLPVVKIANNAFQNNQTLSTIRIPESVKEIGDGAFSDMPLLEEVQIMNPHTSGGTAIGTNVFYNTPANLKILVMPGSVTHYQGMVNWSVYTSQILGDDPESPEAVNPPVLFTGMNPVYWDGGYNEVAKYTDVTTGTLNPNWDETKWYSYTEKPWQLSTAENTTFINNPDDSDIVSVWANAKSLDGSYWVWIPRYIYRFSQGWHEGKSGSIDIKFIVGTSDISAGVNLVNTGSATDSNHTWTSHPAFTFGTQELTGFWFAKFEASKVNNDVNVIPMVAPMMSTSIDQKYAEARQMETKTSVYGWNQNEVDSHMAKATEWGAVTYLSFSVFGRNRSHIYENRLTYTAFYDGRNWAARYTGGVDDSSWTRNPHMTTNEDVSGVYDMNGGFPEVIAAARIWQTSQPNASVYGLSLLTANQKYVNLYPADITLGLLSKGDAIYETSSFDSDNSAWGNHRTELPSANEPWITRNANGLDYGIFGYYGYQGYNSYGFYVYRPVLVPKP